MSETVSSILFIRNGSFANILCETARELMDHELFTLSEKVPFFYTTLARYYDVNVHSLKRVFVARP